MNPLYRRAFLIAEIEVDVLANNSKSIIVPQSAHVRITDTALKPDHSWDEQRTMFAGGIPFDVDKRARLPNVCGLFWETDSGQRWAIQMRNGWPHQTAGSWGGFIDPAIPVLYSRDNIDFRQFYPFVTWGSGIEIVANNLLASTQVFRAQIVGYPDVQNAEELLSLEYTPLGHEFGNINAGVTAAGVGYCLPGYSRLVGTCDAAASTVVLEAVWFFPKDDTPITEASNVETLATVAAGAEAVFNVSIRSHMFNLRMRNSGGVASATNEYQFRALRIPTGG